MNEELLPIGTAVRIPNDTVPFLIVGYYVSDSDGIVHKYLAVDCVLGFGSMNRSIFLDEDGIEEVLSLGYSDSEGDRIRRSISIFANAFTGNDSESDEKDENE